LAIAEIWRLGYDGKRAEHGSVDSTYKSLFLLSILHILGAVHNVVHNFRWVLQSGNNGPWYVLLATAKN